MVKYKWIPRNYQFQYLIFLEKRIISKFFLINTNCEKTLVTYDFLYFMLKKTAKNIFLHLDRIDSLEPITFYKPINHFLIEHFVDDSLYQNQLIEHVWHLHNNTALTFYTDGLVQSAELKAGIAWIETTRIFKLTF